MKFSKEFNLSVRCVRCNAKLDCALRESEDHDLIVLVDRHNCHAVERSAQVDFVECFACGISYPITATHCTKCGGKFAKPLT